MSQKRIVYISLFIYLCLFSSQTSAYFEERYFCTIEKNVIEVSLQDWDEQCFGYIAQITETVNSLEEEIIQTNTYLDQWRNKEYWTEVGNELRARRDNLNHLKSQIITAIDDYEVELFLKVKSLIASYLMPKRQIVLGKITTANGLLEHLKQIGDAENYTFVVRQVEKLQQQLILYDRIRFALSFMELIPPLKLYIQWWGFVLDSIEDKPVQKSTKNIT